MTHATVYIIAKKEAIPDLLAPYDEELDVHKFISRQDTIANFKKLTSDAIKDGQRTLAKATAEVEVAKTTSPLNPDKIKRVTGWRDYLASVIEKNKVLLALSDDQIYTTEYGIRGYDEGKPKEITPEGYICHYNYDAKYDYYSLYKEGHQGFLFKKGSAEGQVSIQKISDLDLTKTKKVYSIVTPDGVWHSEGTLGWFGSSFNEDSDWDKSFKKILSETIKKYPDLPIFSADYHI